MKSPTVKSLTVFVALLTAMTFGSRVTKVTTFSNFFSQKQNKFKKEKVR